MLSKRVVDFKSTPHEPTNNRGRQNSRLRCMIRKRSSPILQMLKRSACRKGLKQRLKSLHNKSTGAPADLERRQKTLPAVQYEHAVFRSITTALKIPDSEKILWKVLLFFTDRLFLDGKNLRQAIAAGSVFDIYAAGKRTDNS